MYLVTRNQIESQSLTRYITLFKYYIYQDVGVIVSAILGLLTPPSPTFQPLCCQQRLEDWTPKQRGALFLDLFDSSILTIQSCFADRRPTNIWP